MDSRPYLEQFLLMQIPQPVRVAGDIDVMHRLKQHEFTIDFEGQFNTKDDVACLINEAITQVQPTEKGCWRVRYLKAWRAIQDTASSTWVGGLRLHRRLGVNPRWYVFGNAQSYRLNEKLIEDLMDKYAKALNSELSRQGKKILASTPHADELVWKRKTQNFYVEILKSPAQDFLMPAAKHLHERSNVNYFAVMKDLVKERKVHYHLEVRIYDASNGEYNDDTLLSFVTTDVYNEDFYATLSRSIEGPVICNTKPTQKQERVLQRMLLGEAVSLAREALLKKQP